MKKNILVYMAFLVLFPCIIVASEKPPVFPVSQKIVPDVWVPEFGYYYADANDTSTIFMGPCSPCVCAQVCNDAGECLYIHQHHSNDVQEPIHKIDRHISLPKNDDKHNLTLTAFTYIDKPEKVGVFNEGNHEKRVENIMKNFHTYAHITAEKLYYTQSLPEENARQGYRDSFVLFKHRKPYRVDIKRQKYVRNLLDPFKNPVMNEYITTMLKEYTDQSIDFKRYDNPLIQIKKPNVSTITTEYEIRKTTQYVQELIKGRPF